MTTREPRVGDRVTVTASRDDLREICAEYAIGLTGYVQEVDQEAHTGGVCHPFRIHFGRGEGSWWLRRSDFTLLDEEPADVRCDECSGDGRAYVGYASDNAYMDCETCEHCHGTGRCSCELCRAEDELARAGSADKMKPREEPGPEPAQPVRTKAETLDLMKDVLRAIAEYEDLSRPWVTKEGHEHLVTASETELVTSGYRALYEKLKESL